MASIHAVLAGDSVFDNDSYVVGVPGVIEQMRKSIPSSWSAFKVAVDGDCIRHVPEQLKRLPTNATDLIVSVGGNDARQYTHLFETMKSPDDLPMLLSAPLVAFRVEYEAMLSELSVLNVKLHVCTIYTAIPFDDPLWRALAPAAIAMFNNVIMDEASKRRIPVFRLDEVCTKKADFSAMSPIEPSATGGQKIVDHMINGLGE